MIIVSSQVLTQQLQFMNYRPIIPHRSFRLFCLCEHAQPVFFAADGHVSRQPAMSVRSAFGAGRRPRLDRAMKQQLKRLTKNEIHVCTHGHYKQNKQNKQEIWNLKNSFMTTLSSTEARRRHLHALD